MTDYLIFYRKLNFIRIIIIILSALFRVTAPQIRRVSRRHYCALYKFIYLLTYLLNKTDSA